MNEVDPLTVWNALFIGVAAGVVLSVVVLAVWVVGRRNPQ